VVLIALTGGNTVAAGMAVAFLPDRQKRPAILLDIEVAEALSP
jgi:hypothetical protein